jgi:phosphoesterase RecJ-like protein
MEIPRKALEEKLFSSQHIIIIPHQHPDGDAIGSATALFDVLHSKGIPTTIFCSTPQNPKWSYLQHADKLTSDVAVFQDLAVDTIIVLDSGDLRYAGVEHVVANHPAFLINIDHHSTNEFFGDLNIVDSTAASTTNILFHIFKELAIPFTPHRSTSLLTGLITDTDNFTNAATTPDAMAAASVLVQAGGDIKTINDLMTRNKSVESLKLWGKVLSRLQKHEQLDLTYTYITQNDIQESQVNESESEGIANFLNNLGDTKIALILKETLDGKIKGSFRTIRDDVDVSAIAKRLGGGGHRRAAGFTTDGTISEVLTRVVQARSETPQSPAEGTTKI